MLFRGDNGIAKDIESAMRWFERSAMQMKDAAALYDYSIILMKVVKSVSWTYEHWMCWVCVRLRFDVYRFTDWCRFLQGEGAKKNNTRGFQLMQKAAKMVSVFLPGDKCVCSLCVTFTKAESVFFFCSRDQSGRWTVWAGTTGMFWKTTKVQWNTLNRQHTKEMQMPFSTWAFFISTGNIQTSHGRTRFEPHILFKWVLSAVNVKNNWRFLFPRIYENTVEFRDCTVVQWWALLPHSITVSSLSVRSLHSFLMHIWVSPAGW